MSICIAHNMVEDTRNSEPKRLKKNISITSPLQVIDLLALMGELCRQLPGLSRRGREDCHQTHQRVWQRLESDRDSSKIKGKLREKVEGAIEDIEMSKFWQPSEPMCPLLSIWTI